MTGSAGAACAGTVLGLSGPDLDGPPGAGRGGELFRIIRFHTVHLDAVRRVEATRAQHEPAGGAY
ncbi:hypothetical protein DMB66_43810 [Actinoplanes sp. ATCC 53533]|nr:hypothetical protein DMB66_43810 [Actinoplanes sp. ATCC 53533]